MSKRKAPQKRSTVNPAVLKMQMDGMERDFHNNMGILANKLSHLEVAYLGMQMLLEEKGIGTPQDMEDLIQKRRDEVRKEEEDRLEAEADVEDEEARIDMAIEREGSVAIDGSDI